MCDAASRVTIVGQLPKLFHTNAVNLWLASFVESKPFDKELRERPAWSFTKHSHLRAQIDSGFVIGFWLPFLADTFVASAHAEHAIIFVVEQVSTGKLRKDVDARFFTFLTEPRSQTIKRDDVIAVVLQRRRRDGRPQRELRCEIKKVIFFYRRLERGTLLFKIWNQLAHSPRIHDGTGKNVRANRRAFLNYCDLDVTERFVFFDQSCEMQRAAQIRRAGAYKHDIKL